MFLRPHKTLQPAWSLNGAYDMKVQQFKGFDCPKLSIQSDSQQRLEALQSWNNSAMDQMNQCDVWGVTHTDEPTHLSQPHEIKKMKCFNAEREKKKDSKNFKPADLLIKSNSAGMK